MKWLFRWLKRNWKVAETPRNKVEEFYLHESWFEHFQEDLASWARRNG